MENRRNDKRLLLPDIQVRVKEHGCGDASSYVDCRPVDISFNGLAFSSAGLTLELLQKIDMELSVGGRTLRGEAVVCHIEDIGKTIRYGVLYIDLRPSLEELFSLSNLTATQVKEMAANLVDSLVIDKALSVEKQRLKKAQSLLFDAVEAFKTRLCQRLGDCIEEQGNSYQLADLFEFAEDRSWVVAPIRAEIGASVNRCKVTPEIINSNHICFRTDDNRIFKNLMEFMQELSDTFELLLAGNNTGF